MKLIGKTLILVVLFSLFSINSYAAPFAYVGNFNVGTLSIIDTADNTLVATLTVGGNPFGIAVHPDGSQAYMTNLFGPEEVKFISSDTHTITGSVPIGNQPTGVAVTPDGTLLYVGSRANATVSVVDIATKTVVDAITVGTGPYDVTINPAGTFVYVANTDGNSVSVIDTSSNTVVNTLNVGLSPNDIRFNRSGSRLYITSGFELNEPKVTVLNASDNSVLATIDFTLAPDGIAVHPLEDRIYVASEGKIHVIDASTNTVSTIIEPPQYTRSIDINPAGTFLYAVTWNVDGIVYAIDTETNQVVGSVTVGEAPYSLGSFIGPAPALSLSRNAIDFGNQEIDTESAEQTATLSNIGTLPVSIDSIDVDVSDFLLSDDCPLELLSNDFCTVTVTFDPFVEGAQTGAITIVDNTNESPHTITLTGTGTTPSPLPVSSGGCSLVPQR